MFFNSFLVAALLSAVNAQTTVIPSDSFSSVERFEQFWNYLYPWGSDHNGSGRMVGSSSDHSHINPSGGTLTLTATPTSNADPPNSSTDPFPAIHYASGAVHAKEQITVTTSQSWTVQGEFSAPTAKGTWPAFWLTAVVGWPPEVDIGEWKGTTDNWFNTFNTSSEVRSDTVPWTDSDFHSLRAELSAESNGADVRIDFFKDDVLQVTQFGAGFVDQALWLIVNLQMEGSSGSPGPDGTTQYLARNIQVTHS